ncbi:Uncharacterised protein [uncultured archaeon]|nr:Uncharacterised protein [uncultured archaeon]
MLSPPEFHYNSVTLTLPVINIIGNASVGGKGTAIVSFKKNAIIVQYPNTSRPDWINRTNPVNYTITKKVFVKITSEYYLAWADYARGLGYTKVSTDPANHTVNIELSVVPSILGEYTYLSSTIPFRGLNKSDTTPLDDFNFKIKPTVNAFDWDIRVQSGYKKLIFHVTGNAKNPGNQVDLTIGYQDDGMMYGRPAETWEGNDKLIVQPDGYVYLDLLNTSINLKYDSVTVGSTTSCYPTKIISGDFNSTNFSWADRIVNTSSPYNQQSLYNITQHYFWKITQGGDFSFGTCGPQSPDLGSSTMLVNYTALGALTFLHVTENRADVEIS